MKTVFTLLLLTSCSSLRDDINTAFDAIEENRRIGEENDYRRGQEKLKQLQESDSVDAYTLIPPSEE